jgi:hypothetical protein
MQRKQQQQQQQLCRLQQLAACLSHLADVEASAEHVCADEDLRLSPPELANHPVTVLKRHVTLQVEGADDAALQRILSLLRKPAT